LQPCNVCVARGVEDKCRFGGSPEATTWNVTAENRSSLHKKARIVSDDHADFERPAAVANLADQTGYSSLNGSNAWVSLHDTIRSTSIEASQRVDMPSSMKEELEDTVAQLPH
jgi:glutathione synthase/RimK-type ligase-like ATP-grasp enzyme